MSVKADRVLAKVARLDADIASLRDRLDTKLNERRTLLTTMINDGEGIRSAVADEVRSLAQANNLAATGRILTEAQVREIRHLASIGWSQTSIARKYNLSQPSIFKIVRRQSYRDVA